MRVSAWSASVLSGHVSIDSKQGEAASEWVGWVFNVGRKSPRVAGESPGPGLFGVQGEPCEPHLATVLCVGTFGGCHLGVECGAEWQYLQLQLQLLQTSIPTLYRYTNN